MRHLSPIRPKKVHDFTWQSELQWYYEYFHWGHFFFLVCPIIPLPLVVKFVDLKLETAILTFCSHIVYGLAITAGYHRLWAHRSYAASAWLRYLLAFIGAGQCQWSILWWCRHHRAHHQHTDTDKDPYNARRGFVFSHIGWLIGHNPSSWGKVDVSDLEQDPVVLWQQQFYVPLAILSAVVIPVSIAHFGWNDGKGGYFYGCCIRLFISMHSTFLVNSLAHATWAGTQPFSESTTARNVPLVALLAGGEGSHNFHHAFPTDYRNGTKWFEPDWSARLIKLCEKLGIAWDLKMTKPSHITEVRSRKERKGGLQRGSEGLSARLTSHLPNMEWGTFAELCASGRRLICINGVVHDVSHFIYDHPGGSQLIESSVGRDVTELFYDGSHPHSQNAREILVGMQMALIRS
ncbi:stearic acid desaturase [Penicillium argentinense]|uniref:Acyl-CoA desaturase n=1 Tax=Penicillium argentinense TaxID=1131581 RepID=A0A9W9KN12_9EURO|nr:stearic acid desaturase [Penicillium argentinense]KAJ5112155.1 stearic acid desaturase [Penicillium argentinense]